MSIRQTVMGDDAGIEAGGSIKKKLEHPVSIDKSRYELRQREILICLNVLSPRRDLRTIRVSLPLPIDETLFSN